MTSAPASEPAAEARIGPNAVVRVMDALVDLCGTETAEQVLAAAGHAALLDRPRAELLSEMMPEATARAVFRAVADTVPQPTACRVFLAAGAATGRYLLTHRIPRLARIVLKLLPPGRAAPLLLKAVARHAWTFAGSGRVETRWDGMTAVVTIRGNPLAVPGCPWHCAVFGTLFRALADPSAAVRHDHDPAGGCRFEIAVRRSSAAFRAPAGAQNS